MMGFSDATIHPVKKGTCQLIKKSFLPFHVDQWDEAVLHLATAEDPGQGTGPLIQKGCHTEKDAETVQSWQLGDCFRRQS